MRDKGSIKLFAVILAVLGVLSGCFNYILLESKLKEACWERLSYANVVVILAWALALSSSVLSVLSGIVGWDVGRNVKRAATCLKAGNCIWRGVALSIFLCFTALDAVHVMVLAAVNAASMVVALIYSNKALHIAGKTTKNGLTRTARKMVVMSVFAGTVLLFSLCFSDSMVRERKEANLAITTAFQAFETRDLNGKPVSQDIFAGSRLAVMYVWGSDCGPCTIELPVLAEVDREYRDRGVFTVGLCADMDAEGKTDPDKLRKVVRIADDMKVEFPILAPTPEIKREVLDNITELPCVFFLDENGKLLGKAEEIGPKQQWESSIDEMLDDMQSSALEPYSN